MIASPPTPLSPSLASSFMRMVPTLPRVSPRVLLRGGWCVQLEASFINKGCPSEPLQPVETENLLAVSVNKPLVSAMSDFWS